MQILSYLRPFPASSGHQKVLELKASIQSPCTCLLSTSTRALTAKCMSLKRLPFSLLLVLWIRNKNRALGGWFSNLCGIHQRSWIDCRLTLTPHLGPHPRGPVCAHCQLGSAMLFHAPPHEVCLSFLRAWWAQGCCTPSLVNGFGQSLKQQLRLDLNL